MPSPRVPTSTSAKLATSGLDVGVDYRLKLADAGQLDFSLLGHLPSQIWKPSRLRALVPMTARGSMVQPVHSVSEVAPQAAHDLDVALGLQHRRKRGGTSCGPPTS